MKVANMGHLVFGYLQTDASVHDSVYSVQFYLEMHVIVNLEPKHNVVQHYRDIAMPVAFNSL